MTAAHGVAGLLQFGGAGDSGARRVNDRRRPHVLVITQVYRPEPNFITADVAERLAEDARVTVVTAHPNYPRGTFYPGTRWWRISRSIENGVEVWRLPMYPDHSLSRVRRALSYLSFALMAAIVAPFVARRPDVVWVYHGPFTTGLAALWFRFVVGSRVLFTCADLWPESFVASGVANHGFLVDLLFRYSRWINRTAHVVICCTRGTLRRSRTDGLGEERLAYIPVWVEAGNTPTLPHMNGGASRNVVYAGNLGPSQRLDTLLRAARLLEDRGLDVGVDIYGSGSMESGYRQLAAELNLRNVTFHGRVTPAEAFAASAGALGQYVALDPSPLFRMTVPSKLYAAFAAGSPLICGLAGEAAELANESTGAVMFDVDDPESLADAIQRVHDLSPVERLGIRARLNDYYRSHFMPTVLLERYVQLLLPLGEASVPAAAAALMSEVLPQGEGD